MRKNRKRLAQAVRMALALGTIGLGLATTPASAQSVTALTREDLQRTGLTSLGDILQHLTLAGPALNTGFNSGGTGETRVDLRDLGSQRTLVLVDGRRWIPSTGALDGTIDLNSIPLAIVERVEILPSGASALYGSDAIAGVVNIVTRRDYEGAEAGAYLGQNDEGDGRVESYDFTIGAKTERASLTAIASYVKQEPILAGDREISSTPIANIPGNDVSGGASSTTPFGRFFRAGVPGSVTFDPATGGYRPFNTFVDSFNFAPDNYLSTPQERTALYVQGRYQLTDGIAFRSEALYNQRRSAQRVAAPMLQVGAVFGTPISIAPGQAFNPFAQPLTRVQFRPGREFARRFEQDVDTWFFGGGFEGELVLFDRKWSWNANYSYAENDENDVSRNLANPSALIAAISPDCGLDGNGTTCADIFHGPDALTDDMARAILFEAKAPREYEQWDYSANVLGDLFDLPAGPVSVGAGVEHRREQGFTQSDAFVAQSQFVLPPARGGFDADEVYAEFAAPLLKDVAFANALTLSAAVRYSDYSTFGSTTSPKVGFLWKPANDWLVRGTWAKGFRAPSVSELFSGTFDISSNYADPCAAQIIDELAADARARCLNGFAGISPVPEGYEQVGFFPATAGGNPQLEPERSITRTLGVVYTPGWAEGLRVSALWYEIELRDVVGLTSAQDLLNRCYVLGDAEACVQGRISRNEVGDLGRIFEGNLNLPNGLETEGYDFGVAYRRETAFGDFDWAWDTTYVSYYGDLGQLGRYDCPTPEVSFLGGISCIGGLASGNTVGTYQANDPRWRVRSNLDTHWRYGDWGATVGIRYYSPLDETCNLPTDSSESELCSDPGDFNIFELRLVGSENRIGSRTYVDLQATWDAPWNGRFTVGLNNAFDRDPPIAYSAPQNSFDPAYPVPGRFWYAQYTQKF